MINLGLVGYPLEHSLSPIIHRVALDSCKLHGNYSLFPIPPGDLNRLKNLLNRIRSSEIKGLNVTIPYKETVVPLLDELTPTAKSIGAVNTIFLQDGELTGDNTDAPGFLTDLRKFIGRQQEISQDYKNALVLGGGGSARAITFALVNDGWNVTLATRRLESAEAIISQFLKYKSQISNIEYQIDSLRSLNLPLHLIINATPIGMSPEIDNSPWPIGLSFPPGAIFYDLVYSPRETKFVLDARAAGFGATTGLGMLVEQAALAFEIWTGQIVSREMLFNALEEQ